MDSLKNKQAAKNSNEEIKKAVALRAQGGGSSALPPYVSKKRKYASDVQLSGKGANGPSARLEICKVFADAPCHGVGKGLMTYQGPVTPSPLPLLVKDNEYAMNTTRSIVRDSDLNYNVGL